MFEAPIHDSSGAARAAGRSRLSEGRAIMAPVTIRCTVTIGCTVTIRYDGRTARRDETLGIEVGW